MERHELIDELTDIQNANYNSFKGTNEAILHTSEDIADLIEQMEVKNRIKEEKLKADFRGFLQGICAWDIPAELKSKLESKIKELE